MTAPRDVDTGPRTILAPLGLRLVDFVLENLVLLVASTLLCGLIGAATSFTGDRAWKDHAVIELGVRFTTDPIEHPLVAARRLEGLIEAAALRRHFGPGYGVTHRRDPHTNTVTRYMDAMVYAHTSSAAASIMNEATAALVAFHGPPHQLEQDILRSQAERFQRLIADAEAAQGSASQHPHEDLSTKLFEGHRLLNGTLSLLSPRRSPPTRVADRLYHPVYPEPPLLVFTLGGLMFGGLLGVFLAGARRMLREHFLSGHVKGQEEALPEDHDPIIREFLLLTVRYRWWLAAITIAATGVGIAMGAALPVSSSARAIVQLAQFPGESAPSGIDVVASQLESEIARLVWAGDLPPSTQLTARVIRDQPPPATQMNMLELEVRAQTPASVEDAMARALSTIAELDSGALAAERARLEAHKTALTADLARLEAPREPPTVGALDGKTLTRAAFDTRAKLIVELSEATRYLSPLRTRPAEVLVPPRIVSESRRSRRLGLGMGGLVAGLFLGYLVAFFFAGARALRSSRD